MKAGDLVVRTTDDDPKPQYKVHRIRANGKVVCKRADEVGNIQKYVFPAGTQFTVQHES